MAKKKNVERPAAPDRHLKPKEGFHLEPELRQALQDYIDATKPKPSKSEVIRLALEEFLTRNGHAPQKPADQK